MEKKKRTDEGTKKRQIYMAKHYIDVKEAMLKVLERENHERVFSDLDLTEEIKSMGVWTSKTVTNVVRVQAGIPGSSIRLIENFKKLRK